jgi:hypothetical protein
VPRWIASLEWWKLDRWLRRPPGGKPGADGDAWFFRACCRLLLCEIGSIHPTVKDQRAQMRDAVATRQPVHPDDHDRNRRVHAASTSLNETVPAARSDAVPGPRVT